MKIIKTSLITCLALISHLSLASQKYDRDLYEHWVDDDGNGRNTRHDLLASLSTTAPTFSKSGRYVQHGRWVSPWTGKVHTSAKALDIDHTIPLAYAHSRGAASWNSYDKRLFANDLRNLQAVEKSLNRKKGAAGPTEWLPPQNQCQYIIRFHRLMLTYRLQYRASEQSKMKALLQQCGS